MCYLVSFKIVFQQITHIFIAQKRLIVFSKKAFVSRHRHITFPLFLENSTWLLTMSLARGVLWFGKSICILIGISIVSIMMLTLQLLFWRLRLRGVITFNLFAFHHNKVSTKSLELASLRVGENRKIQGEIITTRFRLSLMYRRSMLLIVTQHFHS